MTDISHRIGDSVEWPGLRSLTAVIVCIDRTPDETMAWIRRKDNFGDYHYHSVALKELKHARG